jgi:16S rRNA (uracil1498-N3)-methyltransferase
MRINRFFTKFDLAVRQIQIKDVEIYHQIRDVLRLKAGDRIILCDGSSKEAEVEIIEIDIGNKAIKTVVIKIMENDCEPKKEVVLYCSVLKRENLETVVEKATEVGIKKIVPVICERTIKTGLKKERLEKIIKEAAEQSGRGVAPILESVTDFKKAVESAKENDINLLFDLSGEGIKPEERTSQKIGLWVGPEGGWTEKELETVKQNNFKILKLSELTFRAETAAIVAGYLFCL